MSLPRMFGIVAAVLLALGAVTVAAERPGLSSPAAAQAPDAARSRPTPPSVRRPPVQTLAPLSRGTGASGYQCTDNVCTCRGMVDCEAMLNVDSVCRGNPGQCAGHGRPTYSCSCSTIPPPPPPPPQ